MNSGEIGNLCSPDLQSHVISWRRQSGGERWRELKKKDRPASSASSALYALCTDISPGITHPPWIHSVKSGEATTQPQPPRV